MGLRVLSSGLVACFKQGDILDSLWIDRGTRKNIRVSSPRNMYQLYLYKNLITYS